jgi:uncharacterized coiled-coil protein SlyX
MLVVLGFSIAGLIACVLAPAYRRRAARLATAELKRALPLTAAEIAADKDRIRADYAIRIHKLESNLEDLSVETARQLVEINRRDARISALESDVARLATINEEHENARRVLELTITERLPKVEQRLTEAKKLLFERDREIAALTQTAQRQALALDEATQINTQQRNDIHRLNATLTTRAARNRDKAEEQKHETEIALRTEIEALRARVRDQGELIERLQAASGPDGGLHGNELVRVQSSLAEAERALQEAQRPAGPPTEAPASADAEITRLKARIAEQSADVARLTAELAALKADMPESGAPTALTDTEIALKARIAALEGQAAEQSSTILGLRAEVAAGNEKLARQATFYMDEMKRLAAGTRPTAPPAAAEPPPAQPPRLSLAERMNAPRVATVEISSVASAGRGLGGAVTGTNDNGTGDDGSATPAGDADEQAAAAQPSPGGRRQSLLQRITGLEKPVV